MRNVNYETIVRYFNKECTPDEKLQIIRWANESEEHARQLFEWEELYFLGKRADEAEQTKLREAEERLFARIRQEADEGRKTLRWRTWAKYAAAVAVVLTMAGLGVWYLPDTFQPDWQRLATAEGEVKEFMLPDSSRVWLNENSVLEYPEQFEEENRRLRLSGEAYFEIAEVSLLEGEVKASGTHEEGAITLSPGQKVELNKSTGKMMVMNTNPMLDAVWHSDMVKLQNADITQIARLMEEIYDVKVVLSPGVEKLSTYSGELKKKGTAIDMLEALKHTLHIRYRKHQDIVFISPE